MDLNFSAMFEGLGKGTEQLAKIRVDKEAQAAKEAAEERKQLAEQAFQDNLTRWKVKTEHEGAVEIEGLRQTGENVRHGETIEQMKFAETNRRASEKETHENEKLRIGIAQQDSARAAKAEERAQTKALSDAEEHKLKLQLDAQELANKVKAGELASTKAQVDTFGEVVRTADKEMTEATRAYTATQKLGKAERAAGLEAYQTALSNHAKVIGEYGPMYKQAISDMQGGKTTSAAPPTADFPSAPGSAKQYSPQSVEAAVPDAPAEGVGGKPAGAKAPMPNLFAEPATGVAPTTGVAPAAGTNTLTPEERQQYAQKLVTDKKATSIEEAMKVANDPKVPADTVRKNLLSAPATPAGVPAAPQVTQPVQAPPKPAPGLGPKATSSVDPAALEDAQQKLFSSKDGELVTPMIAKLNNPMLSPPVAAKLANDVKAQLQRMFPDIDPAALLKSILDQNNQTATV